MGRSSCRLGCMILFCICLTLGCSKPTGQSASADEEKAVRDTFAAFQAAINSRDADKLWALLDNDSQADAEREAKTIRESYSKANAEEKAEREKALGLPASELTGLTGKGFLMTKRFHGQYHEVPGSKIDKVSLKGDSATIGYIEEDGDKESLELVRQEGKWKLKVKMPRGS
ncbi:MAG TPA: hypothetical protein VKE94_21580 [Gemmataceae bacterium]|nr:hypothetical protein [Gemmataceae bacterium]